MSFNVETILRETAAAHPDRVMLHFGDDQLTYREVEEAAGRVAGGLVDLGLVPGDRVAVQLPNVPAFVTGYFGLMKAGLVMVPVNPLLRAPELAHHLRDSGATVLVTTGAGLGEAAKALGQVDHPITTFVVDPVGTGDVVDGARPFEDLYGSRSLGQAVSRAADDTAVIIYTSGTTGLPKGAELTHFQLYMNCTLVGDTTELHDDDVGMAVLPLFHVFGLSSVLNACARYGCTLVLVPRFDVERVLDSIERHRVSLFAGVPTMYIALLQADRTGRDLTSLRMGSSGGAGMPAEVRLALAEKFPALQILEGYGMSETASAASFNRVGASRPGSVGTPMWGVEMCVVDDGDQRLPPGPAHVGELLIRGHNVMKGYFNNPQATADALRDGWMHTGDLGYVDEDGYYFIVDRKKDLVIRGGYNVYPREVEEVLFGHEAIAEAAVLGRPHDSLGEEVVAFVVLKDGASVDDTALVSFCRERLAAYKYPRQVVLVSELPKGPSGKVLKRELAQRFA